MTTPVRVILAARSGSCDRDQE